MLLFSHLKEEKDNCEGTVFSLQSSVNICNFAIPFWWSLYLKGLVLVLLAVSTDNYKMPSHCMFFGMILGTRIRGRVIGSVWEGIPKPRM